MTKSILLDELNTELVRLNCFGEMLCEQVTANGSVILRDTDSDEAFYCEGLKLLGMLITLPDNHGVGKTWKDITGNERSNVSLPF